MDPAQPEVEAVGVVGEVIVAAGSRETVEAALPRGHRRFDLAGRTMIPGFNEAHNHMIGYGTALGQINAALGFTVSADFLTSLGIQPVRQEKSAKLYDANRFPIICRLISDHVMRQALKKAA